jgi:uncharacterized protein YkwD
MSRTSLCSPLLVLLACLACPSGGGEAGDDLVEDDTIIDGSHGSAWIDSTGTAGESDATTDATAESDATTSESTGESDTTTSESSESDATTTTESGSTTGGGETCTADALALIDLVNAYRSDNGLPAIPASSSLCTVASAHVHDLADNMPHVQPGGCNLHSWSEQGAWSPCCYTPDHAQAMCMWVKPSELTSYPGYGYENAAAGVGSPEQALSLWQSSQGHNEVILNQGIWTDHPWGALGADIHQGFAVLWFGVEPDAP